VYWQVNIFSEIYFDDSGVAFDSF